MCIQGSCGIISSDSYKMKTRTQRRAKEANDKQSGTEHCVCSSYSWHGNRMDGISPCEFVMNAVNGRMGAVVYMDSVPGQYLGE